MFQRRTVVKGVAGLPLAALLADPLLARAAAGTTETVTIATPSGRSISGALALPATLPAPAVLLIHEWWGLNDQIKTMAAELAREGYIALAVDMFDGTVATTPAEARAQVGALNTTEAREDLVSWIDWLKAHESSTGKVATMGWCFGGGWSLGASLAAPDRVDATVIYYGRVERPASVLKTLQGPVMGHFGAQDGFIHTAMVEGFEQELIKAEIAHELFIYDAGHGFANPTSASYADTHAALAWERTLGFLKRTIGA